MANVLVDESSLQSIANAIHEKNGTGDTYKASEMPQAILDIESDTTKEEQEKSVKITENGTTEITPDENQVLSKVTVDVDVKGEEFIGVKYSDFDGNPYMLPRTADTRSLESAFYTNPSGLHNSAYIFANLFSNNSTNPNGGFTVALETVYLPSGIMGLSGTFYYCGKLKNIIGDLSSVTELSRTFFNCSSLTEIPYMPNLEKLNNNSFYNCTGLTSVTFYKVLTTWNTSAFNGCANIETINLVDGWNTAVYAQHCINLSQACLHDMCEKLADMTGQTPLVFKVGETNIAKIDDEHIAMLQQKNIDYS